MKKVLLVISLVLGMATMADAGQLQPLQVVPQLDLSRYAGKWYEIARLPNRFQKTCAGEVTAEYALLANNQIQVVNECRQKTGQTIRAVGQARLATQEGSKAKLAVRFAPAWLSWLPAVWGDYWVLDLAEDYSYAVVGSPDRKYLWVLARSPKLEDATYQSLLQRAAVQGFTVAQVVKTRQIN